MSAQRETALRVQTVGRILNLADTRKLSRSNQLCNYFMDTKEAGCV